MIVPVDTAMESATSMKMTKANLSKIAPQPDHVLRKNRALAEAFIDSREGDDDLRAFLIK